MSSRPQQQKGPSFLEDYVGVHTRIEKFYERYPEGRILTELIPLENQPELVCFKAFIYRDRTNEQADATGHSIDRLNLVKSTFEKLETAAVGRALAMLGFEVKRGIASAEEIEKAERQQPDTSLASDQQKQTILNLLEQKEPGDRRAQRKMLVEMTGKESRDDLTNTEAANLIKKLQG